MVSLGEAVAVDGIDVNLRGPDAAVAQALAGKIDALLLEGNVCSSFSFFLIMISDWIPDTD